MFIKMSGRLKKEPEQRMSRKGPFVLVPIELDTPERAEFGYPRSALIFGYDDKAAQLRSLKTGDHIGVEGDLQLSLNKYGQGQISINMKVKASRIEAFRENVVPIIGEEEPPWN